MVERRGAPFPARDSPDPPLAVKGSAVPARPTPSSPVPEPPSAVSTYDPDPMDVDDDPFPSRGTVGERVALKRRAADASRASTSGAGAGSTRRGVDDVPHVRQMHNWDCGLACVLASLRSMRCDPALDLPHLKALCPTTSIWTVDLAHLLRRFGADVSFFTITLGANPEYAAESFYRDSLADDGARVDALFRGAERAGVQLARRSVHMRSLRRWAADGRWLIIVLVDKRALGPNGIRKTTRTSRSPRDGDGDGVEDGAARVFEGGGFFDFVFGTGTGDAGHGGNGGNRSGGGTSKKSANESASGSNSGYTGHYILVFGYDATTREFLCRDPAGAATLTRVGESAMESARKSFGTDEDLLVVRRAELDPERVREAMEAANGGEKT